MSADTEAPGDPLQAQWACLSCQTKWRLGLARLNPKPRNDAEYFLCPNCRSTNVYPADGGSHQSDAARQPPKEQYDG